MLPAGCDEQILEIDMRFSRRNVEANTATKPSLHREMLLYNKYYLEIWRWDDGVEAAGGGQRIAAPPLAPISIHPITKSTCMTGDDFLPNVNEHHLTRLVSKRPEFSPAPAPAPAPQLKLKLKGQAQAQASESIATTTTYNGQSQQALRRALTQLSLSLGHFAARRLDICLLLANISRPDAPNLHRAVENRLSTRRKRRHKIRRDNTRRHDPSPRTTERVLSRFITREREAHTSHTAHQER
ncbi:hypothetical protein JHW43_001158 [Diplocarpon mali]|nr:hypothetical protein JHW43_001158 [Diplocarpon mali]